MSAEQKTNESAGKRTLSLENNIEKYVQFISWCRFYPDLFLDLIKPPTGGINLQADQRILLRCDARFASVYGCFSRGYSKTLMEILSAHVTAIFFPRIHLAISAQTKSNSASLIKDKFQEIMNFYPMLNNEIAKATFSKDESVILFKNGSRLDNLANSQNSKGQRRHRMTMEESALMDAFTFEDALKPIVEIGRNTVGKYSVIDPEELNQQILFMTTPGWKGSDEYVRNMQMIKNMIDLQGDIVLGSNWMLSCWYGRGSTKAQILSKKKNMSTVTFDQNYGGRWTGSSNNALVNVNRLMDCRVLKTPIMELEHKNDEFYMAIDVARSQKTSNNQSSVCIGKVIRNATTNRITHIDICNLMNISNVKNFTEQTVIIKKLADRYKVRKVVVDGNGLGAGLVDELLKDTVDPNTGQKLGCWDTINTTNRPETADADRIVYDLKAQSAQSKIVSVFIDMVDSKKVRLLEKKQDSDFTEKDREDFERKVLPFIQTDLLFEEVSNLKIKHLPSGAITVEKVVSKLNKDRFSALAYLLWYVNEYENSVVQKITDDDMSKLFHFRPPKIK